MNEQEAPRYTGIHDMSEAGEPEATIDPTLLVGLGIETLDANENVDPSWKLLTAVPDKSAKHKPAQSNSRLENFQDQWRLN